MFSNFWLEAVEAGEDTREVTMLLSTSPPASPRRFVVRTTGAGSFMNKKQLTRRTVRISFTASLQ